MSASALSISFQLYIVTMRSTGNWRQPLCICVSTHLALLVQLDEAGHEPVRRVVALDAHLDTAHPEEDIVKLEEKLRELQ